MPVEPIDRDVLATTAPAALAQLERDVEDLITPLREHIEELRKVLALLDADQQLWLNDMPHERRMIAAVIQVVLPLLKHLEEAKTWWGEKEHPTWKRVHDRLVSLKKAKKERREEDLSLAGIKQRLGK